jgi:hypothetical protein
VKLPTVGEVIKTRLDEIKAAIKEFITESESKVKQRLKKLVIFGAISAVLLTLGITLVGAASLFLLIGAVKYLYTIVPMWEAWIIIGITSAVVAAALFTAFYLTVRKQLSSPKKLPKQTVKSAETEKA